AHPAIVRVRSVRTLLKNRQDSIKRTKFVPTHTDACCRRNAMVNNQRFVITEVTVRQPVHEPIAVRIKLVSGTSLRDTGPAAATGFRKGCRDETVRPSQG